MGRDVALYIALAFFGLAIVGRILIAFYQTGDHGVRVARRGAPLIEIVPGTIFVLSFVCSIGLLLAPVFFSFHVATVAPTLEWMAVGLGGLGIVVTLTAQLQMGQSWRIGVDPGETTSLVTHGLYAKSRNPIYFGIALYWVGMSISFPHWGMWLCALLSWISIEVIVRKIEEPYLRRLHGEKFDAYVERTNRYLIV